MTTRFGLVARASELTATAACAELSGRARNLFWSDGHACRPSKKKEWITWEGVLTFFDAAPSEASLLRIPNCGRRTMDELLAFREKYCIKLPPVERAPELPPLDGSQLLRWKQFFDKLGFDLIIQEKAKK